MEREASAMKGATTFHITSSCGHCVLELPHAVGNSCASSKAEFLSHACAWMYLRPPYLGLCVAVQAGCTAGAVSPAVECRCGVTRCLTSSFSSCMARKRRKRQSHRCFQGTRGDLLCFRLCHDPRPPRSPPRHRQPNWKPCDIGTEISKRVQATRMKTDRTHGAVIGESPYSRA